MNQPLRIRLMSRHDIPLGMRLKAQAGWNQTEADWRRALDLEPAGCFLAEVAGRGVGTTTVCRFDSIGWVAMVLVDESVRGRGVGRRLLQHALDTLDAWGVASVRLDATDMGRPLYEKLGFTAEYQLVRFAGSLGAGSITCADRSRRLDDDHFNLLIELDQRIAATRRRKLLERLRVQTPEDFRWVGTDGRLTGYVTARPGSGAVQLGPGVAADATSMHALLGSLAHRWSGHRVYIDLPMNNRAALNWAETVGLQEQRRFTRMVRGKPVADRPELFVATSGPEKG